VQRLTIWPSCSPLFPASSDRGLLASRSGDLGVPHIGDRIGRSPVAAQLHSSLSLCSCFFLIVHLVMLCLVGFRSHMRAMITGYIAKEGAPDEPAYPRRTLVTAGWQRRLAHRNWRRGPFRRPYGLIPARSRRHFRGRETLTYSTQRLLTSGRSLRASSNAARFQNCACERPAPGRDLSSLLADG